MSCLTLPTVLPGSPCKAGGQIQVILGPMFSGKRNTMEALPACQLRDTTQEALGADVIGIDEGQFFPDIVEFSEAMANSGKTVIVAALDGTFQRKAFGAVLNLVPLAKSVVKLNAVCMECFREAAYTQRLGLEKEVEVIGGADKYHAVCRLCYFQKAAGQPAGPGDKENCPGRPSSGRPSSGRPSSGRRPGPGSRWPRIRSCSTSWPTESPGRPAPPAGHLSPAGAPPPPPNPAAFPKEEEEVRPGPGRVAGCGLPASAGPWGLVLHRLVPLLACPLAFLGSLPGCRSAHDPPGAGTGPALWLGVSPWQTQLLLWGEGPAGHMLL